MAEIEGIFGRHFQSPYVRGQIFFANFCLAFCGGKSFGMGFFHFKTARQE